MEAHRTEMRDGTNLNLLGVDKKTGAQSFTGLQAGSPSCNQNPGLQRPEDGFVHKAMHGQRYSS